MNSRLPYYLGLPIWSKQVWRGGLFRSEAKPADYLAQYAKVFNTVEGNTTFYSVPSEETVAKWCDATPPRFRFAFKFPRIISHDKGLVDALGDVDFFLDRLSPLGSKLGPFFLQLPPYFNRLDRLNTFLERLPKKYCYAVEVRHNDFYGEGLLEQEFLAMLEERDVDRVVFDTTRFQAVVSTDGEIIDAQRRKPKNPRRTDAPGMRPFLRYAGLPTVREDTDGVAFWAERVAAWLRAGKKPFVFMHQAPDDEDAPVLARMFHDALRTHLPELPELPPWPGEIEPKPPEQLSLF